MGGVFVKAENYYAYLDKNKHVCYNWCIVAH